jgi:hypothetical protein
VLSQFAAGRAADCEHRISLPLLRRPANALNVEYQGPRLPRCRLLPPPEWGAADPRARRWLSSGGDPAVLGECSDGCPLPFDDDEADLW